MSRLGCRCRSVPIRRCREQAAKDTTRAEAATAAIVRPVMRIRGPFFLSRNNGVCTTYPTNWEGAGPGGERSAPWGETPWLTGLVPRDDLPVLAFGSADDWEKWLAGQPGEATGVWLKIAKRGSAEATVSYQEALEIAICFGWIDGQKGRLDDDFWLQRFTPRRPAGRWSKINAEKAAALIESGRMRPPGLREVDLAKADGRWETAYAGQRAIEVPDDLRAALAANDVAREFFATISSVNRYAILYRIGSVKRPETRARKIAQYVAMLAEHQTIHP